MRNLDDKSKLALLDGMIRALECEMRIETHAGYPMHAGKIKGKLIPLYQGKNILMDRLALRAAQKNMFRNRAG